MCRCVSRCLAFCFLTAVFTAPVCADEYADLAASISAPLFPTREQARAGFADDAVMLRMEIARRGLREMDAAALGKSRAGSVHSRALATLEECRSTLGKIRSLDADTPDIAAMVDKAITASPALIRNYQNQKPLAGDREAVNLLIAKGVSEAIKAGAIQLQLTAEWQAYRNHYAELRETALELVPVAKQRPCLYGLGITYDISADGARSRVLVTDLVPNGPCAQAGLRVGDALVTIEDHAVVTAAGLNEKALDAMEPAGQGSKVRMSVRRNGKSLEFAVARTMSLNDVPDLLLLSMKGSCDGALDADELSMTNDSGVDLTNCTLLVTLATDAGNAASEQAKQQVHFVKHWPKDRKLVAMYHNTTSTRIARNESFPFVKRATVQIYSDQFQGTNHYSYWNSAERKADLKNYCTRHTEFRGKYLAETDGLIGNGDGLYRSDAGVRIWLNQVADKAPPRLTPSKIKIELRKRNETVSAEWGGSEWQGGGVAPFKSFLSPSFNALGEPDAFEVRLCFHGTDYEHVVRFAVR